MAMLFPVLQQGWLYGCGNSPVRSELGIQKGEIGNALLIANHKQRCVIFQFWMSPELAKERPAHRVPTHYQVL